MLTRRINYYKMYIQIVIQNKTKDGLKMKRKYLVICDKASNNTVGDYEFYPMYLTEAEFDNISWYLEDHKFIMINDVLINVNSIKRIVLVSKEKEQ